MQRILNVYDWTRLAVGDRATVRTTLEGPRPVKIKVNAPAPMSLYFTQEGIAEEIFLAHICGLDEIEFHIEGDYTIFPLGGDVWFDTLDGSDPSVEAVDPASFTQIVERRVRNPEMELMERKMQENIERRMATMYAGFSAEVRQKEMDLEAARKALDAANKAEPLPADGSSPPVEPVAAAADGSGGNA